MLTKTLGAGILAAILATAAGCGASSSQTEKEPMVMVPASDGTRAALGVSTWEVFKVGQGITEQVGVGERGELFRFRTTIRADHSIEVTTTGSAPTWVVRATGGQGVVNPAPEATGAVAVHEAMERDVAAYVRPNQGAVAYDVLVITICGPKSCYDEFFLLADDGSYCSAEYASCQ